MTTTVQLDEASFEGRATTYEVTGEELTSTNSFGRQPVGVGERSVEAGSHAFEHDFPPCSVAVLRIGITR